jgi:hypothetical protein
MTRSSWPWKPNYVDARFVPPYEIDEVLAHFEPGWAKLIRAAFIARKAADIVQVKQKWGRLVVSVTHDGADDSWYTFVERLTRASEETCEICGAEEDVTSAASAKRHWIQTLCPDCRDQREAAE